jgi:hypothetical protein
MFGHVITYLRATLAQWHPRWRRAMNKRRLEAACQQHGCSRSQAQKITLEFFK